jgi:hypothetical protein
MHWITSGYRRNRGSKWRGQDDAILGIIGKGQTGAAVYYDLICLRKDGRTLFEVRKPTESKDEHDDEDEHDSQISGFRPLNLGVHFENRLIMPDWQFWPFLRSGRERLPIAFAWDCDSRVPEDGGYRPRSPWPERAKWRH